MSTEKADPNSPIPTAASRWRKETLDLLNAKYNRLQITRFNFDGLRLPDDMQQRMTFRPDHAEYSRQRHSHGVRKYQQLPANYLRVQV